MVRGPGWGRGAADGRDGAGPEPSPKTSLAMAPMPPSEPMIDEASSGISTIFELGALPIAASASMYFCATK